jgi:hypothetical protein
MKPMARNRISANTTYSRRTGEATVRAYVPMAITHHLGAREGDKLIFEEGCEDAVWKAALKGEYFIVRIERAEQPAPQPVIAEAAPAPSAPLGSLADEVQRRIGGRA